MAEPLPRLLRPRSVAVIGDGDAARAILGNLRAMGYVWEVWAVDPQAVRIEDFRVYPSLRALPKAPDLACVTLGGEAAVAAVAELSQMGSGCAICFGPGDREALRAAAGRMPLLGPGAMGVINTPERLALWPEWQGRMPVKRGVAVMAEAPEPLRALAAPGHGLAVTALLGPGPEAGLEPALALLGDERVTALGLQFDTQPDPLELLALGAAAQKLGKPVLLQGPDRGPGAEALLARAGIARVATVEALIEALKILHMIGPLPAATLAAVTGSVGMAARLSARAREEGLDLVPLTALQKSALRHDLPELDQPQNPLDLGGLHDRDAAALAQIVSEMMSGQAVITLVDGQGALAPDAWQRLLTAAEAAHRRIGMPVALLFADRAGLSRERNTTLRERGLIPLVGCDASMAALAACARLGAPLRPVTPVLLPRPEALGPSRQLSSAEARAALAEHGLDLRAGDAAGGLALSLSADPASGYLLELGSARALLPLGRGEAEAMLRSQGIAREIAGPVVHAVMAVQDYVMAQDGRVAAIRLDPLAVSGAQLRATEAAIHVAPEAPAA